MSNWNLIEEVSVRHAKQSQKCLLLLEWKGREYVSEVIRIEGQYREREKPTVAVCDIVINTCLSRLLIPVN